MFRSYYCGLCKALGKRYGQKSRFTLTYDCTFLALVLDSVFSDEIKVKKGFCLLHPLNKRNIIYNNFFIEYAADCNIILAYNKLLDNKIDDGHLSDNIKSRFFIRSYNKAKSKYPKLTQFIEEKLDSQRSLENQDFDSIDIIAEPFAEICKKLFCNEELIIYLKNENIAEFDNYTIKALEWLGYNIGKWIYIVDACDDIREDHRGNKYNPIIYSKPINEDESIDLYKKRICEDIKFIMDYCLAETGKALDLLNVKHGLGILENIVFSGMRRISMEVVK